MSAFEIWVDSFAGSWPRYSNFSIYRRMFYFADIFLHYPVEIVIKQCKNSIMFFRNSIVMMPG